MYSYFLRIFIVSVNKPSGGGWRKWLVCSSFLGLVPVEPSPLTGCFNGLVSVLRMKMCSVFVYFLDGVVVATGHLVWSSQDCTRTPQLSHRSTSCRDR